MIRVLLCSSVCLGSHFQASHCACLSHARGRPGSPISQAQAVCASCSCMSLVVLGVDLAAGMPWWWCSPVPLTRRMELHDPFAGRDVRLDAGDGTSRRPGG